MLPLRRILFPSDFSNAATHALAHAVGMAERFEAEITLIYVRAPFTDDPYMDAGSGESSEVDEDPEAHLNKLAQKLGTDRLTNVAVRRNISAAAGILEYVEEDSTDIVVMGTHGRSGLSHFFLGSVTEKVVRHSPVPVLTVGLQRQGYRDSPDYQRILAAYDFSEHSKEAVKLAAEMCKAYQAQLRVLYVVDQEVLPGYQETWKVATSQQLPRLSADAIRSIKETIEDSDLENVDIKVELGDGDGRVHRDITRFADENEIDLIVMGTYGLSGFERMLLGSTTERVVRVAPCPVLACHLARSRY
jgi:nucleotide-binding universal stress UspA family protein